LQSRPLLVKKHDFINIVIPLAIAPGIGIYLIATTVLIAKDGVFYIERAQNFSNDPAGIIKAHPPESDLCIIHHSCCFARLFSNTALIFLLLIGLGFSAIIQKTVIVS